MSTTAGQMKAPMPPHLTSLSDTYHQYRSKKQRCPSPNSRDERSGWSEDSCALKQHCVTLSNCWSNEWNEKRGNDTTKVSRKGTKYGLKGQISNWATCPRNSLWSDMDPSKCLRRFHLSSFASSSPLTGPCTTCSMCPCLWLIAYREMMKHRINFHEPPPELIEGEAEYKVEHVLNLWCHRKNKWLQFLIRWKGYSTAYNSWEDAEEVHAPELIEEYFQRKQTAIQTTTLKSKQKLSIIPTSFSSTSLSSPIFIHFTKLLSMDHATPVTIRGLLYAKEMTFRERMA